MYTHYRSQFQQWKPETIQALHEQYINLSSLIKVLCIAPTSPALPLYFYDSYSPTQIELHLSRYY